MMIQRGEGESLLRDATNFVHEYYQTLEKLPQIVYRFYQENSKLGRLEDDGVMSVTTTLEGIRDKVQSYGGYPAEIKTVDAQEFFNGGILVVVTGSIKKETVVLNFSQTLLLVPVEKVYSILNDSFRYEVEEIQDLVQEEEAAVVVDNTPKEVHAAAADIQKEVPVPATVEEVVVKEVTTEVAAPVAAAPVASAPAEVLVKEAPAPSAPEVLVKEAPQAVAAESYFEQIGKRSFASVIKEKPKARPSSSLKQAQAPAQALPSSPSPSPSSPAKVSSTATKKQVIPADAERYSIYVRNLPSDANSVLLESTFKQFGQIKRRGISVKCKEDGFCFGFVEFEEKSSAEKAIQASPIVIKGKKAIVEFRREREALVKNEGTRLPYKGNQKPGNRSNNGNQDQKATAASKSNKEGEVDGNEKAEHMEGWTVVKTKSKPASAA